jgi:hypothetical protein
MTAVEALSTAPRLCYTPARMPGLLAALDAFLQEHRRCGGPACQRFLPGLTEQSPLTQPLRTKASRDLAAITRTARLLQRIHGRVARLQLEGG